MVTKKEREFLAGSRLYALAKLYKHAIGALGMHKTDEFVIRASLGLFVQKDEAF